MASALGILQQGLPYRVRKKRHRPRLHRIDNGFAVPECPVRGAPGGWSFGVQLQLRICSARTGQARRVDGGHARTRLLQQGALPGGIKSTQTPINVISCLVVYHLCNARREIRLTWKLLLTVVAVDCSVQDVPSVRMYIPTGYTEEASAVAALAVRPNEADQLQPIDPLSVQETAEAMGGGLSLYIVTGNKSSEFSAMRESNQGFASPRYISYPVGLWGRVKRGAPHTA